MFNLNKRAAKSTVFVGYIYPKYRIDIARIDRIYSFKYKTCRVDRSIN